MIQIQEEQLENLPEHGEDENGDDEGDEGGGVARRVDLFVVGEVGRLQRTEELKVLGRPAGDQQEAPVPSPLPTPENNNPASSFPW